MLEKINQSSTKNFLEEKEKALRLSETQPFRLGLKPLIDSLREKIEGEVGPHNEDDDEHEHDPKKCNACQHPLNRNANELEGLSFVTINTEMLYGEDMSVVLRLANHILNQFGANWVKYKAPSDASVSDKELYEKIHEAYEIVEKEKFR